MICNSKCCESLDFCYFATAQYEYQLIWNGEMDKIIERKAYTDNIKGFIDKEVIKIITGIRRCGKSEILKLLKKEVLKITDKEHIVFINKDFLLKETF
jgi:predicted AAA+ superfamily ATPase